MIYSIFMSIFSIRIRLSDHQPITEGEEGSIDFESKYNWFFMKDTECKSKNTYDITILNE